MQVEFKDFEKLNFRIGKILEVERIRKSDKLYKLQVDIGEKTIQLVSGIADSYSEIELRGKKIVVFANLEPVEIMGEISEGMVLCAIDKNDRYSLLTVDRDMEEGSEIC